MVEGIALVLTAILGSTGIASVANSLTLWGRKAKLRRSIRHMTEDLKILEPLSAEMQACKAALSVQALELASLNLIKNKPFKIWVICMTFGSVLFGLFLGIARGFLNTNIDLNEFLDTLFSSPELLIIVYIVLIPIVLFVSMQSVLSYRRHRFVAEAWNSNHAKKDLILKHSLYLRSGKGKSESDDEKSESSCAELRGNSNE